MINFFNYKKNKRELKILKEILAIVKELKQDDRQIFIELKNKLKASRERLIASFGENKKSQ